MRRDDDDQEPDDVLQQPAVDEIGPGHLAVLVERLVVDVEQHHDAERDQRQGQLDAEQVVQPLDRLARQPVPDAEHLDDRFQRTAARVLQRGRGFRRPSVGPDAAVPDAVDVVVVVVAVAVAVVLVVVVAAAGPPAPTTATAPRDLQRRPERHRIPVPAENSMSVLFVFFFFF